MTTPISQRFNESTRGRIVAILRGASKTVDELAAALQLTDNAVRPHLVALERDGMVRQRGSRRGEGAGKPAIIYELHPDAEPLLSRAYAPVLGALLEVLSAQLPPREMRKVLRETGRRLAASSGGQVGGGDLATRARAAAAVLTALGGAVEVEQRRGSVTLRGSACPLATAVRRSPVVCAAVESLVGEISGANATECCNREDRPHCCFELRTAS